LISAGALPQTPLGSLQRSPRPLSGFIGAYFQGRGGRGKRGGDERGGETMEEKGRERRPFW